MLKSIQGQDEALKNILPFFSGIACIQGQDEGTTPINGGGSVTRYYHNPITGNCETFQYQGGGGNANNFESQEQCESYCKTCKSLKERKNCGRNKLLVLEKK